MNLYLFTGDLSVSTEAEIEGRFGVFANSSEARAAGIFPLPFTTQDREALELLNQAIMFEPLDADDIKALEQIHLHKITNEELENAVVVTLRNR